MKYYPSLAVWSAPYYYVDLAFIGISQTVYTNNGQPSFGQPKTMTDIGLGVAYRPKCPPRDECSTLAILEHNLNYSVAEPESRLQNIGNRSTGRRPWLFFLSPQIITVTPLYCTHNRRHGLQLAHRPNGNGISRVSCWSTTTAEVRNTM